jgi:hypothetical protein
MVYSRRTSVKAGTLNHLDFVVLYLATHGPSKASSIDRAHAAWLGTPATYRYFAWFVFNLAYCYVSLGFTSLQPAILPPCYGFGSQSGTFIFKPRRGVYALNAQGITRLQHILSS